MSPKPARRTPRTSEVARHPIKPDVAPATQLQEASINTQKPRKSLSSAETNGVHPTPPARKPAYALPPASGPPGLSVRGTQEAYAQIEAREQSPIDMPGFEGPRQEWHDRSRKRALDVNVKEDARRKVRLHFRFLNAQQLTY